MRAKVVIHSEGMPSSKKIRNGGNEQKFTFTNDIYICVTRSEMHRFVIFVNTKRKITHNLDLLRRGGSNRFNDMNAS